MTSTFGWTLEIVKEVTMEDMVYLLEGSQKYGQRQERNMKQKSNERPGKRTINNINQIPHLPGVRTIRKKR